MPASPAELAQVKAWARALVQLVEAIEARDKAETLAVGNGAAPAPRASRIP
jgi:hypothetical protein